MPEVPIALECGTKPVMVEVKVFTAQVVIVVVEGTAPVIVDVAGTIDVVARLAVEEATPVPCGVDGEEDTVVPVGLECVVVAPSVDVAVVLWQPPLQLVMVMVEVVRDV